MTWPRRPLGQVAAIERVGVDPKTLAGDVPYLGLEHIERGGRILGSQTVGEAELASTKFAFDEGHVLFGKLRPNLGKVARPTFSGVCSTDILPIRPGPDLDRAYLHHYLAQPSMVDFAASRTSGANLPRLSPAVLATFDVPMPSLDEQRRIAAILDQADAVRNKRRQALGYLDGLTRAVFNMMFGDEELPSVRLRELVDDDDRINYGVVQPGDHVPEGVPLIRVSDLRGGLVDRSRMKRVSHGIEAKHKRSRIRGTEVLVSCVGSIGVVALTSPEDVGSNVARAVTRVPISDPELRVYVAAVLASARVQRYFTNELRTVSQPTLNGKQIGETLIPLPPGPMLKTFAERVHAVESQREIFSASLRELEDLHKSLQANAFSGNL